MKIYKSTSIENNINPYTFGRDSVLLYSFESIVNECYYNYKEGLIEFSSADMVSYIQDELNAENLSNKIQDILDFKIETSEKFVKFIQLSPLMEGKIDKAYMNKLIEWESKKNYEKYKILADDAYRRGRYIKALEYYKKTQCISHSVLVDNNIGATYINLHNYTKALYYLEKALKYSDDINIKVNLIKVYKMQNRYDYALEKIYEYLKNEYSWQLLIQAGEIFLKKADYNQAISLFVSAYEQKKEDEILYRIVDTRIASNQLDLALEEVKLFNQPNSEYYYLLTSKILMKQNQKEEAIDLLEKGCIMVNTSSIYIELARLYRMNNRIIDAIKNITIASELSTLANQEIIYEMALIAKMAGNNKDYNNKLNVLIESMKKNMRIKFSYD